MRQPELVPKSQLQRVRELLHAALVIRDALTGLQQGLQHQIIPLSGQLRALLTDRSEKKSPPLLLDLAARHGLDLTIYGSKPVTPNSGLVASFGGFTFAMTK